MWSKKVEHILIIVQWKGKPLSSIGFTHFVSVLLEGEYKTFDELGDLSVEQWNQIFFGDFLCETKLYWPMFPCL